MKQGKQKGRLPQEKSTRTRQVGSLPVERYFREWLASAHYRLKVPLQIVGRTGSTLNIRFVGITPHLEIYLHAWELGVAVIHHQECWDLIHANETIPQKRHQGYACRLCLPEAQKVYATLGSLWRAHTFEPFLTWVNERLYPAKWLCLYGSSGVTAASLLVDENEVSQRVCENPDALFREVLPDGTIRMSPEDGTIIELLPLRTA